MAPASSTCTAVLQPPPHTACTKPKWNPNGITVAGTGQSGSSAAELSMPRGIFVDQFDDLYVADSGNYRIQKFTNGSRSGVTVAGGNGYGSAANKLSTAGDVFVDTDGNIFVADTLNERIQLWTVNSTEGQTLIKIKWPGPYYFSPDGVFVDEQGGIYVSENPSSSERLSQVVKYALDSTAGIYVAVSVYIDECSYPHQCNNPKGLYVDQCHDIYVADSALNIVQKVANKVPTTVAGVKEKWGSNSTHMRGPVDVTVDSYGGVYIADQQNHRVQRVSAKDGTMETIAGVGKHCGFNDTHLCQPASVQLDSKWNLYVSDFSRVQKFLFEGGDLYC